MEKLRLDFETFSETDISDVGAIRYSECPTTEVLILGYKIDDNPVKSITSFDWDKLPADLKAAILDEEVLITAFNASFERSIIEQVLCKRHGWPKPTATRYRCTQALCASLSLPLALDKAAKVLNLDDGKDKRGKQLIKLFSVPQKEKKSKKNPNPKTFRILPEDDIDQFIEFVEYCEQDVVVEEAIENKLIKFPMTKSEVDLWHLDQKINRRGIPLDIPTVKKAFDMVTKYTADLIEPFHNLTGGLRPTQRAKVLDWLNDRGCELDNLQAETLLDFLKNPPDVPKECIEVVEIRTSAARSSNGKLIKMLECVSDDGRARGTLQFCGALKTGRWAGRLIQPHNFPRPQIKQTKIALDLIKHNSIEELVMMFGDPLMTISSTLRHMIAAPEGREFIVADYAAIEARVVCWLAGQWDAVERFIEGIDAYCHMAMSIYPRMSYQQIKDKNDFERQLGKQAVLGCGFGMGWKTFKTTCEGYGMNVSDELAEKTVNAYRTTHPEVRNYWYAVERAAIQAVKSGRIVKLNNLKFGVIEGFLFIVLPSGRRLAYPNVKLVQKKTSWGEMKETIRFTGVKNGQPCVEHTYGGKLVENITQAVARDLMAYGMKCTENTIYEIITTIHDEIVSEVNKGAGSVEEFEGMISQLPAWAKSLRLRLPLKAEGYRDIVYKKG